jgi:hypothetical protein
MYSVVLPNLQLIAWIQVSGPFHKWHLCVVDSIVHFCSSFLRHCCKYHSIIGVPKL